MRLRLLIPIAALVLLGAWLLAAPDEAQAHLCSDCHTVHGSPGGSLNVATNFNLVCDTCHLTGNGAILPRVPPLVVTHTNISCTRNCGERPFYLGCDTCHSQHRNLTNRKYDQGLDHGHTTPALCESANPGVNLITCDGVNRKLVGRDVDAIRIAKIATPITVSGGSWAGGVATVNLSVNNAPNPPAHTIMAGDRIIVRNIWSANNAAGDFDLGFNGEFRVVSVTNPYSLTPTITYSLAADPGARTVNDTARNDPDTGSVQAIGWTVQPSVYSATWDGASATLQLARQQSIQVGDAIAVSGVVSGNNPGGAFNSGFNGVFTVATVSGITVTYALVGDPGAHDPATGTVSYAGSTKSILAASQNTGAATLTLTAYRSHAIQPNSIVTVFKDDSNPATFTAADSTKRLIVSSITTVDTDRDGLVLACINQAILGSEACDLSVALPVDFTGGIVQSSGTMKFVAFESRGTTNGVNEDDSHSFADQDQDGDNVMEGVCELCHTRSGNNYPNYLLESHNDGKTCSASCHVHNRAAGGFFR